MFNVSDYLKKFIRLSGDLESTNLAIHKALFEICAIEGATFEIKKGIVHIKAEAAAKSMVFMRKRELLERVRTTVPHAKIHDIR